MRRDVLSFVVRYDAMEMAAMIIIIAVISVIKSVDWIRQRLSA